MYIDAAPLYCVPWKLIGEQVMPRETVGRK